ncbi:MAG: protein translocase subunit SecD [Candidatus Blackburnbacteria bacterium]|nr:protein translocase subunit SecD [Candidatus Blackburnbacteria bacterium]
MRQWKKLLIILAIVLGSVYVALPPTLPIKFSYKKFKVDQTLNRSPLSIMLGEYFSFQRDLNIKLGLDLAGGSHLVFEADMSKIGESDKKFAVEGARDAIERRINLFGVAESTVQTSQAGNSHRINIDLPGVKDTQGAIALIGQTAQLDFRELLPIPKEATDTPRFVTYQNTRSTGFTGNDFKRARSDFDSSTGKPVVSFETKPESAKKFADITTRLQGQPLAIFLDQVPISNPTVSNPITDGRGIITGQFTLAQTKSLANLLNSGALPVPIHLIEQRTIEASLGAESIQASIFAGLVGLAMVILFMVLYYGRLGIVASIALLIYGLISLSIYKLIPIVLTLPGVAGFILSVGMAVDSNILIFERMKEELALGKPWRDSMETAFGRAWDSIRDANIATLLTSFILFNPLNLSFLHTSGPVRGFAATLFLGVAIGLFTGIFVTRTLLRVFVRKQ